MVTIYALINPFNNEPFYVGATVVSLHTRLLQHLNTKYNGGVAKKIEIINLAKEQGKKIKIVSLLVCPKKAAIKCELHIYELLTSYGFVLHQLKGRICNHTPLMEM